MDSMPLDQEPTPFPSPPPPALLNPLHFSAHFLHRSSLTEPRETLSHPFAVPFTPRQSLSVAQLRLCKSLHEPGRPVPQHGTGRELPPRDADEHQLYLSEGIQERNNGHSLQRENQHHLSSCKDRPGNTRSEKQKKSQDQRLYRKGHVTDSGRFESLSDDRLFVNHADTESAGASRSEESSKDVVNGAPLEVSGEEVVHMSSGASEGESQNENTNSNDSSSGKDMVHDLSLHEDEKGQVSPLRALSHIAHIKRKQDCMQAELEQVQELHRPDVLQELYREMPYGSPSKKKRFRQVQFQLEALTYQKLIKFLAEQHQGSFQRFVMATLNSIVVQDKVEKKSVMINRRPGFSKWKRTRFDQLKGNETQDLAIAFRSLAEAMPNVEVTSELMHTPWQELNMLQIQKMLEETKKMLLVNEKIHDCPYADCGRRFSTPGSLKDHLNEHSGEHPYRCRFDDCLLRFRSKQHLCRHMKKHERAHTCTVEGCNKRFAFRERLIVHQKIHSDERPLSCPWEGCGKTFKWANSLHGHMRTHTGEKPFQCTFAGCGRLFGYKVDLTRHRRTHLGQPARASH